MIGNAMRRALVLAGGGYVASSWELGLATGMADAGLDIRDADLFVGTSSGARVALDLASGKPLEEFYQRRAESDPPHPGRGPAIDWARIKSGVEDAKQAGGSTSDILRRYGALAKEVSAAPGADRRQSVAAQIPMRDWPDRDVKIVTVHAESGERRVFDRGSGIDLVDAVIASTASFGAPLVEFEGGHFFDGGYHSSDNADLAMGYGRVLILALRPPPQAMRLVPLEDAVERLRAAGSQVEVIHPDEGTIAAMAAAGGQMNPASGRPAAVAGREQGRRCAVERIAAFWR